MKAGVFAGVATLVATVLAAGCASASTASGQHPPAASLAQGSTGFVGYRWTVTVVSHDGHQLSIYDRRVTLQFSAHGQFGADDSATFYSGSYQLTDDGFSTRDIGATASGSAGILAADVRTRIAAIQAVTQATDVPATVDGTRLTVTAGSYTLTCTRSGPQSDDPTPTPTATSTAS